MLDQNKLKEIQKLNGKVRGSVFVTDTKYVTEQKGKKGLEELTKRIKKENPDFDLDDIKNTKWYPLEWRVLMLLAAQETFGWNRKDIYEWGRAAPGTSFVVKTLMRYFTTFEKTTQQASAYWRKHYSIGELEAVEFNSKEKYVIFRLKNFSVHPVTCPYLAGFFQGMGELTNPSEKIKTTETKCVFKGDDYHEFIIEWE